jgi:hypothetical protein
MTTPNHHSPKADDEDDYGVTNAQSSTLSLLLCLVMVIAAILAAIPCCH